MVKQITKRYRSLEDKNTIKSSNQTTHNIVNDEKKVNSTEIQKTENVVTVEKNTESDNQKKKNNKPNSNTVSNNNIVKKGKEDE
jgi:hypothetical protein